MSRLLQFRTSSTRAGGQDDGSTQTPSNKSSYSENVFLLQHSTTVTSTTKVYQNISECVELYLRISKYDILSVLGVKFEMLEVEIVWDVICFNACLKNGFFESCFQQSAKGKMTALTVRSYHIFAKIYCDDCICNQKLDFQAPPPFEFSLSN